MKKVILSIFFTILITSFSYADENQTIVLSVPGMTCPSCAASVESELEKLKGITDIDINIGNKTVTLKLSKNSLIKKSDFSNAIKNAGFELKN